MKKMRLVGSIALIMVRVSMVSSLLMSWYLYLSKGELDKAKID